MAFVFCDGFEKVALGYATGRLTTVRNVILRLFKNDYTPSELDEAADYTEADFPGYAAKTLTGASWTDANPTAYAQQLFSANATVTPNQAIYGYYYTRETDGDLIGGEAFPEGATTLVNNGDTVRVTPGLGAN